MEVKMVKSLWKFILTVQIFLLCCTISIAQSQIAKQIQCTKTNQIIKKQLTIGNPLYLALERHEIGEGIQKPWMGEMKSLGIKHATSAVYFKKEGKRIELTLGPPHFYSQYYLFTSELEFDSPSQLESKARIEQELMFPFYNEALRFLHVLKNKQFCGSVYIHLLDDACLPIIYNTNSFSISCRNEMTLRNQQP